VGAPAPPPAIIAPALPVARRDAGARSRGLEGSYVPYATSDQMEGASEAREAAEGGPPGPDRLQVQVHA
jgi:hypothetical protein